MPVGSWSLLASLSRSSHGRFSVLLYPPLVWTQACVPFHSCCPFSYRVTQE